MPKFAFPMTLLLASVAIAMPASADEASASLKILSGASMAADWYGDGAVTMRKQLCVASSTGRYSLDVTMPGALFGKTPGDSAIEVRFADAAGFAQSKSVSGPSQIVFSGTSVSGAEDCLSGTLASIEIYVPATTLMSQPAGNYFDQISLAVRPL
jgi:hypothetical protein